MNDARVELSCWLMKRDDFLGSAAAQSIEKLINEMHWEWMRCCSLKFWSFDLILAGYYLEKRTSRDSQSSIITYCERSLQRALESDERSYGMFNWLKMKNAYRLQKSFIRFSSTFIVQGSSEESWNVLLSRNIVRDCSKFFMFGWLCGIHTSSSVIIVVSLLLFSLCWIIHMMENPHRGKKRG